MLIEDFEDFLTVPRFSHDLEIFFQGQQLAQAIAKNGMVVSDNDPDEFVPLDLRKCGGLSFGNGAILSHVHCSNTRLRVVLCFRQFRSALDRLGYFTYNTVLCGVMYVL